MSKMDKTENMEKKKDRGSNQSVAIALGLAMLLGITGCAAKENEPPQMDVLAEADTKEGDSENEQDDGDAAGESEPTEIGAGEAGAEESGGQTINFTEGAEHLGGKIQSLGDDGMTFAHTSLVEDGSVTLLEVEDAEKIEVKFTADTKVEHWIIQGGGAGIDMQNAAFSDLQEGMGVELEGYYDGETFVATKVIMEDYE